MVALVRTLSLHRVATIIRRKELLGPVLTIGGTVHRQLVHRGRIVLGIGSRMLYYGNFP